MIHTKDVTPSQPVIIKTNHGLSIAGTRLTLDHVMDYLKAGWPIHLIQQWLDLTDQQMADIMDYVTTHSEEVEAEYEQALQLAEDSHRYWEIHNQERFAKIAASRPRSEQNEIWAKIQARKVELGLA